MKQGLYAQVVMIFRKYSENQKEKENTKKYNFQGIYAISRRWLDLDHKWLELISWHMKQISIKKITRK